MSVVTSEGVRCAAWARAEGIDPVGSAGCYAGFLLIELPLPWPRDIAEHADVQHVATLARKAGLRLQALIPSGSEPSVIAYRRPQPNGPFTGFVHDEAVVRVNLASTAANLLATPPSAARTTPPTRDLLVCTHGRRDVCCGSLGTTLALSLGQLSLPADVRSWRTSHTGGHRFAPTFIVLPEATAWAYADQDLVQRVLARRGAAAEVADRYRGCSGLSSPAVQALEREVLRRTDWDLLDRPRQGADLGNGRVQLEIQGGAGDGVWEAEVGPGRLLPVPDCRRPIEEAKKSEHEWIVTRLRRY